MGLENPIHLLLIMVVILMVFGAKRLPEMGRGLGDGMRGFKDALSGNSPAAQTITPAVEPHLDPMVATATTAHEAPVAVGVGADVRDTAA